MESVQGQEIYIEYANDVAQYFINQVDEEALSTEEHILLDRKIKIFNLERLLTRTKFWYTIVNKYENKMIAHIEKLQSLTFSLDFALPATTTATETTTKVNDFLKEIRQEQETQNKPVANGGSGGTGASSLSSTTKPSSGPAPATTDPSQTTDPAPTQRVSGKLFQTATETSVAATAAVTAVAEQAVVTERHYISVKTRTVFADYKIKITVEEVNVQANNGELPEGVLDLLEMGYKSGFDLIGVEIWAIGILWGSLAVVLGLV